LCLLDYRLAWARSYLKKVGGLDNSTRGIWTLTDKGRAMTEEDCKTVPSQVRKEYSDTRKNSNTTQKDEPKNSIEFEDNEFDWKEKLLAVLIKIDPSAFERLCQRILRESGFTKVEVTGKSNDGGIDGIGILRMNLVSFTVLFQCKRYKDSVGSSVVRDFRGAMQGRCDKGLIMTTGNFTSEAKKEATRDGAPTIDLIDGESLCELLKSLRLGVSVQQIEEISVEENWFSSI
jgi:restriction system protein